jgi:hypothetical protein
VEVCERRGEKDPPTQESRARKNCAIVRPEAIQQNKRSGLRAQLSFVGIDQPMTGCPDLAAMGRQVEIADRRYNMTEVRGSRTIAAIGVADNTRATLHLACLFACATPSSFDVFARRRVFR